MINYGVRAGGGIGDELPKISFFKSPSYYTGTFFYNMIFQIIVVLVLGNIFLGIIVDTFAELRDEKNKFETDQSNVCYICQLNRENSIYYIDFDNHVNFDHNVMNYIYFIIYLNVNNVMNFNLYELNSYKMLKYNNIEWIPRVENDE